ncbi:MAG: molybdenum cofactor biosynthesis protein B [Halobacteriales archaeon]
MVDFQERDTRRGIDDGGSEGADESGDERDEGTPAEDHADHHHGTAGELGVAVLTVSSTREAADDESGDAIAELCDGAGHEIATRDLVADDHDRIQKAVDTLTRRRDVDLVITTGGTGVTPDDVTPEAVEPLFEKALPGFGELFRRRSEADVGTRIVATRATAGIAGGVPVFCLPGSEAAVRLGTEEIVLEEADHLAHLAERGHDEE